jgi:hypothetical protein
VDAERPEEATEPKSSNGYTVNRRTALKGAAALATAMGTLELVGKVAHLPNRAGAAEARGGRGGNDVTAAALPDIQFDIGNFIAPAQSLGGIQMQLPPVHTVFLTARLLRRPTRTDQAEMNRAMDTLEANYPFAAGGVITFVSYGLPYFRRLPSSLVTSAIPRLRSNTSRLALEEAVASPTDVSPRNPGITKLNFNVPVRIEANDVLFTLRGDNQTFVQDAVSWLGGSNRLAGRPITSPAFGRLLQFTSSRAMFTQLGLPKFVAAQANLPFQQFIHPQTPMWMGFADQQVDAAGPAAITTFAGNPSARLTSARPGDYFDNGSIQHLSHVILDMRQWFDLDANNVPGDDGVFTERVQYMYHSPAIDPGSADQLTNSGGPAFLRNENRGANYARQTAQGIGTEDNEHRIGHLSSLQRSSRAADGTPIHIRMDGPGFDNLDVPGGGREPKLQFTAFIPTADFFATMRRNQASLDLVQQFEVEEAENSLERFLTTTRRQNFLVPPRRHRGFPLVEFL